MSDRSPGLERALGEVRAGAPQYRRWWCREHGAGVRTPPRWAPPPWCEQDEDSVARIGSVDPWWLRSVAHELDRAHAELGDVAAALSGLAGSAIGAAASRRCAVLAATCHGRASEAAALAAACRTAGERADDLLDDVARRLTEVLNGDTPGRSAEPGYPAGCRSGPGSGGSPDGGFSGYPAVLRAVRAELSSAIERLPALLGLHPADHAGSGGRSVAPDPAGWVSGTGTPGPWAPEPGSGPLLPGTDARRVETGTGVRIARLPDGPR